MLDTPIGQLAGIGTAAEDALHKAGIFTVWQLLLLRPIRYEDRTQLTDTAQWQAGHPIQVEGVIARQQQLPTRKPSYVLTLHTDDTALQLRFLNYGNWVHTLPKVGERIRVFGNLRYDMQGHAELLHPSITRLNQRPPALPTHLTPIYPTIGKLKQALLRKAIDDALSRITHVKDTTPIFRDHPITTSQALHQIHHAAPGDALPLLTGKHPAIQRLALEELTAQQLLATEARQAFLHSEAIPLTDKNTLIPRLIAQLPFQLTQGQQKVWQDIQADLAQPSPMHRLLQGDVGSGKTVLAALAACQAASTGVQTSIMAPTEILAEQLFATLSPWLSTVGITCRLLTSQTKAADKRNSLLALKDGSLSIIIGTHSLFQEQVSYHQLGLVIVDEQHRFGVEQRLALKQKGQQDKQLPHLLLMTATPIPRTLAMSLYGDLTISSLRERPPGRQSIETVVIPEQKREMVAERLVQSCQKGTQAYWVCPFIEASETIDAHNVTDTFLWFKARYPQLRTGLVHGQMSSKEKDQQMQTFKAGMLDLLIATTVIEVGVNVPNASLMIIDNSERYGLAQLHQLRGRVGRGSLKSNCVLLYRPPLTEQGQARLSAIRDSQDGFLLAEQDLQLRGPGEVLGTRQTGLSSWQIADLLRDSTLHEPAKAYADQLWQHSPTEAKQLMQRWFSQQLEYSQA